jgi:hypothetical protein
MVTIYHGGVSGGLFFFPFALVTVTTAPQAETVVLNMPRLSVPARCRFLAAMANHTAQSGTPQYSVVDGVGAPSATNRVIPLVNVPTTSDTPGITYATPDTAGNLEEEQFDIRIDGVLVKPSFILSTDLLSLRVVLDAGESVTNFQVTLVGFVDLAEKDAAPVG